MFIEVDEKYKDLVAVKYAQDVVSGKIVAGRFIIFECKRFLEDLNSIKDDEFEWDYDLDLYKFITKIQELFKFADGIKTGETMKMADFQEWIITQLFCWKSKKHGYVRFTKAYIEVARKNGKTFLLGYLLLIKCLLVKYGQFYCVATKKDQSAILVKEVKKLLDNAIEEVKSRFIIYGKASISKILCEVTQSEIIPLSSDVNTLDGLGADMSVIDEYGIHKNAQLYEVMRSSQIYKLNAQLVAITTAYSNTGTSPAYKERCEIVDSYNGATPLDSRYFGAIYEMDLPRDDFRDKKNWIKANPLLSQFPEIIKRMESDFNNATKDREKLNLFLTKNLNVWLDQDSLESYLEFDEWRSYQVDEVDLEGKEVIVGIDLSKSTDLTGVSIIAKDGDNFLVKAKAFLPKAVINQKEATDKLPYGSYLNHERDWIEATDGKFVDQKIVEAYIRNIESKYGCYIKKIAFDSWGALGLMSSLKDDYEVVDVKMNYRNFSPSIKSFREKVYGGRVQHEYNPVLNFCVANAVTKSDTQENILLDKKRSTNRIDLIVATIIGYSEWFNDENEEEFGYFSV